jgi:hypothetical protein
LKKPEKYQQHLQGFLLMDRGFSNKIVHKRLEKYPVKSISPPYASQRKKGITLLPKEWKLYAKRWEIETVFQKLKDSSGDYKLTLCGANVFALLEARFILSLLKYNLNRQSSRARPQGAFDDFLLVFLFAYS